MRRVGRRGFASTNVGVLDAGVVLVRLDRRHRSHAVVSELFARAADSRLVLHLSVVNLAEVLQHSLRHARATGLDVVAMLCAFSVSLHRPDTEVARRAAALASWPHTSLADRFAAATAAALAARLYTTDGALADSLERERLPVTRF